jgi:hypothetical protein
MKNISVFVIEEESIQQIIKIFRSEKTEAPTFKNGEIKIHYDAVTLESEKLFKEAAIPFHKVQISNEATVFDIIKQCKGEFFRPDSFTRKHYPGYSIEYGYILRRPQIDAFSDEDFRQYNKEIVGERYQQKISDLGIADNEILILESVEVLTLKHPRVSADHQITFPPTVVDFTNIVHENPVNQGTVLHMALLYTDADEDLPCFVREYYEDLHVLSGSWLNVYAIEKVNTNRNLQEVLRYWKSLLSEKTYVIWSSLGWLRTKPYNKSQCYEIGRSLGIGPSQFPCVALFDTPTPDRVLVFPIVKPYINFFRSLFEDLKNVLTEENLKNVALEVDNLKERNERGEFKDARMYKFLVEALKGGTIAHGGKKYTRVREKLLANSLLESSLGVDKHILNGKTFFVNFYLGETSMTENRQIHTGGGSYYESINTSGGSYIQGNYIEMSQDLTHAAAQIQDLIEQLQKRGMNADSAQEQVAQDIAAKSQNDPTVKDKLIKWGQSLGSATITDVVKGTVKIAIRSAGIPLP